MIQTLKIDNQLSNLVKNEVYSIKVPWQYLPVTTLHYESADMLDQNILRSINDTYGPISDTQKMCWGMYIDGKTHNKKFEEIRSNPSAPLLMRFPNIFKLVNDLQTVANLTNFRVVRLMVNMQMIRPQWSLNTPHPDFQNKQYVTVLYYVNDSDGDTYFFEGSKCFFKTKPEQGIAVKFPSHILHAGSNPIKTETRTVINMCFAPID